MKMIVNKKEYTVKFGYNSFCDTDLLDRTNALLNLFHEEKAENDTDVRAMGKLKDLFTCVRDLLYVGFQKKNPVESVQEIGDILDDYYDETHKGIMDLFTMLAEELMSEGFLGNLLKPEQEVEPEQK